MAQIPLWINHIPHPTLEHLDLYPASASQFPYQTQPAHLSSSPRKEKRVHTRKPTINPPIPEHTLPHLRLRQTSNTHDKRVPRARHKSNLAKTGRKRREKFLGELFSIHVSIALAISMVLALGPVCLVSGIVCILNPGETRRKGGGGTYISGSEHPFTLRAVFDCDSGQGCGCRCCCCGRGGRGICGCA